jgi:4-hydroxybenzoate polyprenyltransferase
VTSQVLTAPLRFFVYSNLFIAVCAVLMVSQTSYLLLHTDPAFYTIGFVFFSTICSYSFHWYLSSEEVIVRSPRTAWQRQNKIAHLLLFVIGLAGASILFFKLAQHWYWLLFAAGITFLYSAPKIPHPYFRALRKIAIGKTIFLALVWTYVTSTLPILLSDASWKPEFYLFNISRFFLIYAICILFDYRDREDDRAKGIRSLITFLDQKGIRNLFIISLSIFGASTIALSFFHFSALIVIILLIPGIITSILYKHALKNFSDLLYYLVLDGLMALSSILTLLTRI